MLTPLTAEIIEVALTTRGEKLDLLLKDLEYHELTTLYTMCLHLSKTIRNAPNFTRKLPEKQS